MDKISNDLVDAMKFEENQIKKVQGPPRKDRKGGCPQMEAVQKELDVLPATDEQDDPTP